MKNKTISKKLKTEGQEYPKVIETFRELGSYYLSELQKDEPTSFNGNVQIKKYRITIEEIVEPVEVYEKRLQELWDNCDNHHHWNPLKYEADKIGYTLIGEAGKTNKRGGSF